MFPTSHVFHLSPAILLPNGARANPPASDDSTEVIFPTQCDAMSVAVARASSPPPRHSWRASSILVETAFLGVGFSEMLGGVACDTSGEFLRALLNKVNGLLTESPRAAEPTARCSSRPSGKDCARYTEDIQAEA